MGLGEILDRTFQIYRSRFLLFLGIAALPALGIAGFRLLRLLFGFVADQTTLSRPTKLAIKSIVEWLPVDQVSWFFVWLAWPTFVVIASRLFLGEETRFRSAVAACVARWRSCVSYIAVLWAVWSVVPAYVNRLPGVREYVFSASRTVFGGSHQFAYLTYPFFFLVQFLLVSVLIVAFSPGVPAWTIEELGVRASLARGWSLAKRIFPTCFFAWCMVSLIAFLLFLLLTFIPMFAVQAVWQSTYPMGILYKLRVIVVAFAFVASAVSAFPLYPIALTLFYYDQRIRREGYDIERMMEDAGLVAPEVEPETVSAPAAAAMEETEI
jgi:hypothetical protein